MPVNPILLCAYRLQFSNQICRPISPDVSRVGLYVNRGQKPKNEYVAEGL